jgi:hypothetical protein
VLSDKLKGYFCKYCFLFATKGGSKKQTPLNQLVVKPLNNFSKLFGKDGILHTHANHNYHKDAIITAKDFLNVLKNPQSNIANIIDSHRMQLVKENRIRLIPIIETIIFLSNQNISFRSHRDDGPLDFNNQGNFKELPKYRIHAGDTNLEKHLQNSSSRATYISKTTQNSLIKCCGEEVINIIVKRVNESKIYSIIFDVKRLIYRMNRNLLLFYDIFIMA